MSEDKEKYEVDDTPAEVEKAEQPEQSEHKPNRFQRRLQRSRQQTAEANAKVVDLQAKLDSATRQDPKAGGPQMGSFDDFEDFEKARQEWESRPVADRTTSSGQGIEHAAQEFRAQLDEWDDAPTGAMDKITSNNWSPTETMITTMIDLDNGPETALWLAEHPKTVSRLANMDDGRQRDELVRIADRINRNADSKRAAKPKGDPGNPLDAPTGAGEGAPTDWSKASFKDYEAARTKDDPSKAGRW